MALFAYVSNRMEVLVDNLVEILMGDPLDPMEREIIVVQSHGMDRWLTLTLARKMGSCANLHFPFPRRFIAQALKCLFNLSPTSLDIWEPEYLLWDILKTLPSLLERPAFESLKPFFSEEKFDEIGFDLAGDIANAFDRYLIYRPDLLAAWERGRDNHWQAQLWRELRKEKPSRPLTLEFPHLLRDVGKPGEKSLPRRVSLFGVSALPPIFLEFFFLFSHYFDVHFFLLNPCQEYWGDILSPREESTYLNSIHTAEKGDFHLSRGNSLLASLGRKGREFFDFWEGRASHFEVITREDFREPGKDTLLHALQSQILHLEENPAGEFSDDSIQIHSCHGPLREIEVLQDYLLEFLRRDETLKPADILVMAPDIDFYSPYIKAVFSLPESDPRSIPFSVADSRVFSNSRLLRTFFKIGKLKDSRYKASELCEILECPPVRKKFGITEEELEVILSWINRVGIRWGADANMKAELGLPAVETGTWKAGIERMLLGYVLPPDDRDSAFLGIVPFGGIEGGNRDILAKFLDFFQLLDGIVKLFKEKSSPLEWSTRFRSLLNDLFLIETDEEFLAAQELQRSIHVLEETIRATGYEKPISADLAFDFLARHLNTVRGTTGFLSGGITFSHLVPMRSIPFRVICLIGMNFQAFPRLHRRPGFDLMSMKPRPQDPSPRHEDRYIFLEALLSARDVLFISYSGQSPEDNKPLLPSVVVSELIDYIKQNFSLSREIVTVHHLQAFHPAYFTPGSGLFSYSRENFEATKALIQSEEKDFSFIPESLGEFEPSTNILTVDELVKFYTHPCRFLVKERLNMDLESPQVILEDEEPFALEPLHEYTIKDELLKKGLDIYESHLARGILPYEALGKFYYELLKAEILSFKKRLSLYREGPEEIKAIDLTVNDWLITGRLKNLYPSGLLYFRPVKKKGKDIIAAWIMHIIFHAAYPDDKRPTWVFFLDGISKFGIPNNCLSLLETLVHIFEEGQKRPLKFFPDLSMTYIETRQKGKNKQEALKKVRGQWETTFGYSPKNDDPYFNLCFREKDPFDEEFISLAHLICSPIFAHMEFEK